jgi:hypothetical protein
MDRDHLLWSIPQGILQLLMGLCKHGPQAVEIGLLLVELVERGQMANLDALHSAGYSIPYIAQKLCAVRQSQRGQFCASQIPLIHGVGSGTISTFFNGKRG